MNSLGERHILPGHDGFEKTFVLVTVHSVD